MADTFPGKVVHGGTGKREREKTLQNLLDFSASINPLPPRFDWCVTPDALAAYPDNEYVELKEIIGKVFRRDPTEICVGNGSIELIRLFCQMTLSKEKTFYADTPTFGEYALSARLAGARIFSSAVGVDLRFICNPNNPTGTLVSRSAILDELSRTAPGRWVFVDEAFIELSDPEQSVASVRDERLFTLRSLTKCFSVPGIRFGYGFGPADLVEKIETARPPWSVNAYAEAFARQAFLHFDELQKSRNYISHEREWLTSQISNQGYRPHPSRVNYILVDCPCEAAKLCELLEEKGVLVRDCTSFGLPKSIRVAVGTHEENRVLIEALSSCMH